jgi:hypothetical protein
MADITVRAGDELDVMTLGSPLGACSTRAEFAVVWMCPKNDDAQLAVTDRRLALLTLRRHTERRKRGGCDSRELEK